MVFRRFSSLSSGDNDKLSASAIFKSCHKGIWAFATLLYHVIQLSGGLGQALKQSAQRFKSTLWLPKGILFASLEIKSMGFSWVRGPWQKDFGFEGCGKRISDTWSSEIQKYAYGVRFQDLKFQKLNKLRNIKRIRLNVTFRPQIAASSTVGFVVWAAESAIVQICWLKVWLLWVLIQILGAWRVLARICRAGYSNYVRI